MSAESKQRYTDKVTGVGLKKDPYTIPSEHWQAELNHVPNVALRTCLYIWLLLQVLIPRKR